MTSNPMTMTFGASSPVFRTADLSLTAVISVLGFGIEQIERVSPSRSVFIFEDSASLQETVSLYWRGDLRIEPRAYFDELKRIKARLYQR